MRRRPLSFPVLAAWALPQEFSAGKSTFFALIARRRLCEFTQCHSNLTQRRCAIFAAVLHLIKVNELRQSLLIEHIVLDAVVDNANTTDVIDDRRIGDVSFDLGILLKHRIEGPL